MTIDLTYETVFSFEGPNLCLLGNENDFDKLARHIVDLSGIEGLEIELNSLDFITNIGVEKKVYFKRIKGANLLGHFDAEGNLRFDLDKIYWDRIFRYFILMSWQKSTYYLNLEDCFTDFNLVQNCNFICSSEY